MPRAAGELVGDIGGQSFRRFGFVQSSIVSRWAEIVGERYAQGLLAQIDPVPRRPQDRGVLTLLVDGAHAPLIQHLTPLIIERVNRFFGHAAINRDRVSPGQAARRRRPGPTGRSFARCPRSWAKACAKSPTPSFAPVWSRLPRKLPLLAGRLAVPRRAKPSFP